MNPEASQFRDMSFAEKLHLLEVLWNDIADSSEQLPIPDWQKEELDRRKRNFEANPDSAVSWDEVKDRMRKADG